MIPLIAFGFFIGLLASGSGLGGGFLVVPFMIYLGKEAKVAVGTSFVFIFIVAIASLFAHWRLGNIDMRTALSLAAGGVIGAQIGPPILQHVPDKYFEWFFGALLIAIGIWLFFRTRSP